MNDKQMINKWGGKLLYRLQATSSLNVKELEKKMIKEEKDHRTFSYYHKYHKCKLTIKECAMGMFLHNLANLQGKEALTVGALVDGLADSYIYASALWDSQRHYHTMKAWWEEMPEAAKIFFKEWKYKDAYSEEEIHV